MDKSVANQKQEEFDFVWRFISYFEGMEGGREGVRERGLSSTLRCQQNGHYRIYVRFLTIVYVRFFMVFKCALENVYSLTPRLPALFGGEGRRLVGKADESVLQGPLLSL
jgi:hypothetical protein